MRGFIEDALELWMLGTFVCAIGVVARTWTGI